MARRDNPPISPFSKWGYRGDFRRGVGIIRMKGFSGRSCGAFLVLIMLILWIIIEPYACSADIQPGNMYVDVRKFTDRDAKKIGKTLNHPYEFSDDVVTKILSSIHYREKGLFKKKTSSSVFTSAEVRALTPLVLEAFARATASDYVIVYSVVDRVLLSDLHTYCILFITENELNITFTTIQQRLSYNVTESEKARIEKLFDKPIDITKSAFWGLVPVDGQRLKEGHENWLLVDLKAVPPLYTSPFKGEGRAGVTKGEAKLQVTQETAYADDLEERVKRLEEDKARSSERVLLAPAKPPEVADEDVYIRADIAKDYVPKTSSELGVQSSETEELKNLDIKEKLKRLRALRDEGLITEDDYRSKKAHIVRQEQKNKSIREKLKELRDMKDEGLITEKDYEALKKEVLDKWF